MIVAAWVLLIVFGLVLLVIFNAGSVDGEDFAALFISAIMVAVSAGIIWGGLFQ